MNNQSTEQHWQVLVLLLKNIAAEKGITREQISDKTGMKASSISRIFSLRYRVTLANYVSIAQAIGVNLFIDDKDSKAVEDAEETLRKEQEQENISSWSALTNLDYLRCNNGSLTGDISSWPAFVIDAVQRAISESIIEYISQHPTEQPSNTRELSDEDYGKAFMDNVKYIVNANKLIDALDSYVKLLDDELNEVVPLANVHGWRSKRFEVGEMARDKINSLREQHTSPKPNK